METFRNYGANICLALLLMAVAGLNGDEEHTNFNASNKGNVPFVNLSNSSTQVNNSYNKVTKVSLNDSGGGGGGGGGGWGWGWGGGGGGGGWWKWGCGSKPRHDGKRKRGWRSMSHYDKNKVEDYIVGQFAQCMIKNRCKGMRLDCPLHCGGPCYYDCHNMCKAHCPRP